MAAAQPAVPGVGVTLRIVSVTCLVISATIASASKGRHLAWPAFLAVAVLTWFVD